MGILLSVTNMETAMDDKARGTALTEKVLDDDAIREL